MCDTLIRTNQTEYIGQSHGLRSYDGVDKLSVEYENKLEVVLGTYCKALAHALPFTKTQI